MDVQKYIASGVLEAYWAGELNEQEMREVEAMASQHPEVKQELEELREALNEFAAMKDALPDEDVLNEAMKEVEESEQNRFWEVLSEDDRSFVKRAKFSLWAVAATILLLISLGFNFYFFGQFQQAREELAQAKVESQQLAQQISDTREKLEYAQLRIAHFLNEDNIHVRMEGEDISPESYANVFWNKKTNAVFISVDNLPEPPHGHQYQLWAIKPGQPPIDAGIFDHNQLVQELKVVKGKVQAFAVTLEKEGGSPVATVDKTYVKGFLQAG